MTQLLPTPSANLGSGRGSQHPEKAKRGGHQVSLDDVSEHVLLPTPVAQPSGNTPEDHLRKKPGREVVTDLAIIVENGLIETGGRLMPTPTVSDANGVGAHGDGGLDLRTTVSLLRTPCATEADGGPRNPDRPGATMRLSDQVREQLLMPTPKASDGEKGGPNQRGSKGDLALPSAAVQLLQTPSVADGMGGHLTRSGERSSENLLPGQAKEMATNWGPYEPAIRRWELIFGHPAPAPTEPSDAWVKMIAKRKAGLDKRPVGMRGSISPAHRLSPRFAEWMMGIPAGWVTGVPGISRNNMLKAIGNGVCTQQAEAALLDMLAAFESQEGIAA